MSLAAISTGVLAQAPSSPKTDNSKTIDPDLIAKRKQEQEQPRTEVPIDGKILDNYVGYYQLGPENVLTITREGDRLFAQLSRQPASQVYPESPKKLFSKAGHAQFSFLADAQGHAISLILHQMVRSTLRNESTRLRRTAWQDNSQSELRTARRKWAVKQRYVAQSNPFKLATRTTTK